MRIVVLVATQNEWLSLLKLLGNHSAIQEAPIGEFVDIHYDNASLVAVHSGVGKVNAAAAAQYAILTWRPDRLVVLGTSGAVSPDLAVLDVVVADRTIVYDMVSDVGGNIDENIRDLTTLLSVPHLPVDSSIHVGTVLTGDRDVTPASAETLYRLYGGLVADWESGAAAKVCKMNRVDCLVLRGVSDTPYVTDATQHDSYVQNTPRVMERLWRLLPQLLPIR
ncbi:MAG: hypothetical protein ACM3XM_11330 [Mycobacterium leprae]